jgi:uncharacterized protein YjiS (DUF1127 family)
MRSFVMHGRSSDDTLLGRLAHWRRGVAQRRRAARELAMLNSLNDYLLRDIGMEREPHRRRD